MIEYRRIKNNWLKEAVLTPHAYHLHLLKAFRGIEISDLLSGEDLLRFNKWFDATTGNSLVKPVLARVGKCRLHFYVAYNVVYMTTRLHCSLDHSVV